MPPLLLPVSKATAAIYGNLVALIAEVSKLGDGKNGKTFVKVLDVPVSQIRPIEGRAKWDSSFATDYIGKIGVLIGTDDKLDSLVLFNGIDLWFRNEWLEVVTEPPADGETLLSLVPAAKSIVEFCDKEKSMLGAMRKTEYTDKAAAEEVGKAIECLPQ